MSSIQRVALVVPAVLLVAACSAQHTTASSSSDSSGASSSSVGNSAHPLGATPRPASAAAPTANQVRDVSLPPQSRAVISTGQIALHSKDLSQTMARLQGLLVGWQGTIANEQSSADRSGRPTDTTLVLRVPSSHFSEAMTAISGLGQLVSQSRTSQDVTTKVIDVNVRVRAQKESLRQMEQLLASAKNLGQILSIEDQLSSRQADLDSLESQQKYLDDQTSLATINVSLSLPPKVVVHHAVSHNFLTGLQAGWRALGRSTVALLTVVGAVLPFALVLGVVGFPLLVLVRRRLHAKPAAAAEV